MIAHQITYMGQACIAACDARCSKAFGINLRPRHEYEDAGDEDDFAWLADDEVGEAPADPGTYEGGYGKPSAIDGGPASGVLNKWCVRECERSDIFKPHEPVILRDFSRRLNNMPGRDK